MLHFTGRCDPCVAAGSQFQLSLGKVHATSSDYSLNGLFGVRLVEWPLGHVVQVAVSGSQTSDHPVESRKASQIYRYLLAVISVYFYFGSSCVYASNYEIL